MHELTYLTHSVRQQKKRQLLDLRHLFTIKKQDKPC